MNDLQINLKEKNDNPVTYVINELHAKHIKS